MGEGGLAMRLRESGYFVGAVSDFLGRVVPEQRTGWADSTAPLRPLV